MVCKDKKKGNENAGIMVKSIKVSVIVPIYNVEKYLSECINSVINQSLKEIEIFLIDDGSTDGSGKICDDFAKMDDRIIVIHQENHGLSVARNIGLCKAKGKYIYFLDSDDYIVQTALEDLYLIAEKSILDMICFEAKIISDLDIPVNVDSYIKKGDYNRIQDGKRMLCDLLQNDEYTASVTLEFVRTEVLIQNNLQFFAGIIHEDELYTFQLFTVCKRVQILKRQLYCRRYRPNSIMTTKDNEKHFNGYAVACAEMIRWYLLNKKEFPNTEVIKKMLESRYKTAIMFYIDISKDNQWKYKNEFNRLKKV